MLVYSVDGRIPEPGLYKSQVVEFRDFSVVGDKANMQFLGVTR